MGWYLIFIFLSLEGKRASKRKGEREKKRKKERERSITAIQQKYMLHQQ